MEKIEMNLFELIERFLEPVLIGSD